MYCSEIGVQLYFLLINSLLFRHYVFDTATFFSQFEIPSSLCILFSYKQCVFMHTLSSSTCFFVPSSVSNNTFDCSGFVCGMFNNWKSGFSCFFLMNLKIILLTTTRHKGSDWNVDINCGENGNFIQLFCLNLFQILCFMSLNKIYGSKP